MTRIASVKPHPISVPLTDVLWTAHEELKSSSVIVVEVRTDDGLTGYGQIHGSPMTAICAWVERFGEIVRGMDALAHVAVWDRLFSLTCPRPGGIAGADGLPPPLPRGERPQIMAAIGGIDIALWDIKGKALGAPVYQLLGGAFQDPVPCYSSSVYWDTPEGAAAQARAFVDQEFKAFKVKVGLDLKNDIASLHAIREEVGYEVDMLVDANQCYTRHLALRMGRELEKLEVPFFEEPLSIDDVDGHAFLADKLDVRIATGENMYTRWDFLPFFLKSAIHVAQPDASRCGGISEAKRIADLASTHHLHAIPHTFSDALTIAANLHVVAASSNAPIIEYDRTYNEIQEKLVRNPLAVQNSFIELPTEPGLGVEIDWDFVEEHPYTGEIGIGAGSRPAFGLATEVIPDRTARSLA